MRASLNLFRGTAGLSYPRFETGKGNRIDMVTISKDEVREPLFAVVPVHNVWRHKTRYKHTDRAIKHFVDSGAVVILVECGFNRRELVYADCGLDGTVASCGIGGEYRHRYIGLHSKDELWLKENLINVGVQHLTLEHHDWEQVCWLDSDIHFARPNWVGEAIHKLQHGTQSGAVFLQMFSQAQDLGPNYEMLPQDYPHASGSGFVHAWKQGTLKTSLSPEILADLTAIGSDIEKLVKDFGKLITDLKPTYPTPRIWPGLAWACSRPAWDGVGGLFDTAIWGGADWHMSHALIEKTDGMMLDALHPNYKNLVNEWYGRCKTHIRRNVISMDGVVFHNWHGRKTERGYNTKHDLLAKSGFDPLRHLRRDASGLWALHDDGSETYLMVRDTLRKIAADRNEDSNETGLNFHPQGH